MKKDRIKTMRETFKDDPDSSDIHLDFYDRSKLIQWARQHPSVMLWLKGKLGHGYSGWQPYGPWSNPPQGADDTLISASGITITMPSSRGQKFTIEDAINPMRELVRQTTKAIRITGLSGVGKTRIVQALFDEAVGTNALDRTVAVYVDIGANPDPSATAMLDRLFAEGRRAILILDNCPSELHSSLASRVSASSKGVSLITVEYDIREDKPQTTEVIHIEAVGSEVAERLLIRRFPGLGHNNARRIAEFADGNARVSLAIAERVEEGESLAKLSDNQLFNRLFEQRRDPDDNLREQAEILSLVYSFSVLKSETGLQELEVLGSILGHSQSQLLRALSKLAERHVLQKRAHWRAILPHAIANKLAASALNIIPVDQLRATFEAAGCQRMLMSFAHRLGLLHDHPAAKEIVEAWLQPGGVLGRILDLDTSSARMLAYIGPVAPEALLDKIEAELTAHDFKAMEPRFNPLRATILKLLQSLAYEPSAFIRCVRLLIRMANSEDAGNNYDAVQDKITKFFQAYLSGTHASLAQRIAMIDECLSSSVDGHRSLGLRMLSTALNGPPWTGSGVSEFGARPRDFGFNPTRDELIEWRGAFIDVAVRLGVSGDPCLEGSARLILADRFRGMWHQKSIRGKLVDAARKLHAYSPWGEGWKAVRSTIYFDHTKRKAEDHVEPIPDDLAALDKELEPDDLVPTIITYVLSRGNDYWVLDVDFDHDDVDRYKEAEKRLEARAVQLGESFAASDHGLDELVSGLFSTDWMPYRAAFGRGLAKGSHNLRVTWQQLLEGLKQHNEANKNFAVFGGFIEEVDSIDPVIAVELLDLCARHPELRQALVGLHPKREFTENDLDRCIALLDDSDTRAGMYGPVLWRDEYVNLPAERVLELAQRLLSKPDGDDVVLDAISMRLHGENEEVDTLGSAFRSVGLRAAIQRLQRNQDDPGGAMDYDMERVVSAAFRFDGNETEKSEWLDTIFAVVDEHYGYAGAFESAIETTAALAPKAFLERVFDGTEEQQHRRLVFVRHGGLHRSPLAKINVEGLIECCRVRNDSTGWTSIASGINLWSNDGDVGAVTISLEAMRLLEASPEAEAVLREFAERVKPSSWSGSLASVMQSRADAIGGLIAHERADISAAAKTISAEVAKWIESEKAQERREDEGREQRFE
jgi:nucleotidyltransferase/DNA polymerase involved in DNA repair